jgi:hypothetical protein
MREALQWATMSVRGGRTSRPSYGSRNEERTVFDASASDRAQSLGPSSDDEITVQHAFPRAPDEARDAEAAQTTERLPADSEGPTPAFLEAQTLSDSSRRVEPDPSGMAPTCQPSEPRKVERGSRLSLVAAFLAAAISAFAVYFAVRGRKSRVLSHAATSSASVEVAPPIPWPPAISAAPAIAATAVPLADFDLDDADAAAITTSSATPTPTPTPTAIAMTTTAATTTAATAATPPAITTAITTATASSTATATATTTTTATSAGGTAVAAAPEATTAARPRAKVDAAAAVDEAGTTPSSAGEDAALQPARFDDEGDAGATAP